MLGRWLAVTGPVNGLEATRGPRPARRSRMTAFVARGGRLRCCSEPVH